MDGVQWSTSSRSNYNLRDTISHCTVQLVYYIYFFRHYLLDLLRVTPRDANYTGPGSRFCILRPELITAYCQAQAAKALKSKEKNFQEVDNLATES
ncbi:hypothetical protein JHK82_022740 [Glycine max]|uniref:Uncharacterized protein n=1 Tax=Glycine soja TaxID=3848 RepID=A0A0B2QR87_GLYSO|nr:hypothetical protein JHK85_023237 [Glycine max]KAG5026854.1 hypothetical protein JHK86_022768 [Glycine max]KAG5138009.1 hypothetical protein JHK82_022740 [Glycine max]KHN24126.1 hypothetical protein glysoja_036361 [Glycine soja]